MFKRFAAIALFVAFAVPATSFAIPSITASPSSVEEGVASVISLFFNVFPGDVVTAGGASIATSSGTTFTAQTGFPVAGAATILAPLLPQSFGSVFGPNCGNAGCAIAVGAHLFATLTITSSVGDGPPIGPGDLILTAGAFVQAPFCQGTVSNQGATLVSITPVPEPTAVVLIGGALAGLAFLRRRTR